MLQLLLTLTAVVALTIVAKLARERLDPRTVRVGTVAAFFAYILVNLVLTVFSRDIGSGAYLELRPFQSYVRIFKQIELNMVNVTGFWRMLFQGVKPWSGILLNILLYYPLGFLLPMLFPKLKLWHGVLIGLLCSVATEAAQYLLAIGWCEMDDLLHNTLGTFIGGWVWKRLNDNLKGTTRAK